MTHNSDTNLPKTLEDYLDLPWTYTIEPSDDFQEPWTIRVNELKGCMSHGKTRFEAVEKIQEAIESYITCCLQFGDDIPTPLDKTKYKGIITYRTNAETHYKLAREAQKKHVSINKLIDDVIGKELA